MKMSTRIAIGSTVLFGGVIAFAAATPSPTSAPTKPSYGDYSVVSEKNIFLRDRTRGSASRTTNPSPGSTTRHERAVEETLVLTGVVYEDGGFRAYVEDRNNDKILRLAQGDIVGKGRLGQIEIDAVLYQTSTKPPLWIEIGSDFTGKPYELPTDSGSSASSGSSDSPFTLTGSPGSSQTSGRSSSSQPALNSNDPNLSIEQRMKLRAQEQQRAGRR
jgi:hypothetical protein